MQREIDDSIIVVRRRHYLKNKTQCTERRCHHSDVAVTLAVSRGRC